MATLQQQIDDLRRRLDSLPADARAADIAPLEADARALLTASQNTPYEEEARSLFADLARQSTTPAPESAAVRSLLRRARIRMEIAAGDDDFDEAIDILANALAQDPSNDDTLALLQQAAQRNSQLAMKVSDLRSRYQIAVEEPAMEAESAVEEEAEPGSEPAEPAAPGT